MDTPARASSRSASSVARTAPCRSSTRRRATRTRSPPLWQRRWDGTADPAACPAAGTNKTSPPPSASRTPENRTARMRGMHQPDDQSGRPYKGTKRARIGKGSGYTHRWFGRNADSFLYVDSAMHRPAVTPPDTNRDKKKTAARAAFPQRAGRFPRVWQVLGSNQRRLSRRFYRPLPLATRATCLVPQALAAQRRIAQDAARRRTEGKPAGFPGVTTWVRAGGLAWSRGISRVFFRHRVQA